MKLKVVGKLPLEKSTIKRILVRATNWIGDAVMTIPTIEAIRENFPSSHLTVLARPWVITLLETHPAVDQVLSFERGRGVIKDVEEIFRVVRIIRRSKFDMAVLLQNAFEAALLAYLGGIRIRVGYDTDGRGLLLTHAVIRNADILKAHQVEYYLTILRSMGWDANSRDPFISVSDDDNRTIDRLLRSRGIGPESLIVGLSPGAVYGPAKRWHPERFAVIGDWAVERWNAVVILMGSRGEMDICREVSRAMAHGAVNFCGLTSLGEAMALLRKCRYFVTNDSGLMHVGAALGVPMVAVFGSTDPGATGPRSKNARIVRRPQDCSPCLKPECPTDFRCMRSIEPEAVWQELTRLKAQQEMVETRNSILET